MAHSWLYSVDSSLTFKVNNDHRRYLKSLASVKEEFHFVSLKLFQFLL